MPESSVLLLATAWTSAHIAVGWIVVLSNGLAGAWAIAAHFLEKVRHKTLWWFTAAAQITIFVQGFIGVLVLNASDIEPPDFHLFYGFLCMFGVAILYGYRVQMEKHRYLLYGWGSLFIMGLAIRAMMLDDPVVDPLLPTWTVGLW